MTIPTNQQLRQFILASFNENELYTFCFDYFEGVEHNFSDTMPMLKKVIELISYCNRHQIRENLLVALEQERPQTYRAAFAARQSERRARPRVYSPQPRNPQQVFVSHASEDAALAHQIARDLERNGYDIFITPDSIQPGEKWVPAINRGLEASGIFVVLLTPDAVQSGWVQDETNTAVTLANAGHMRLFLLDVAPCQPPVLWRQRQFVSFRESNYQQDMENLLTTLTGAKAPVQKPKKQLPKTSEYIERRPGGGQVQNPRIVTIKSSDSPLPPPQKSESWKQFKPVSNSFVHEKTGLEFVRIPAGEFTYSYKAIQKKKLFGIYYKTEYEDGRLHLPEYWISKTPVTQAIYQRFIAANPKYDDVPFRNEDWAKPYNWDAKRRTHPPDKADHPVVLVSWYDAVAFCEWAGLQLPTEAQWEKAARGTDGRTYPWGNNAPTNKLCNFTGNVGSTTPVGQYSPQGDSLYGCVDMSGNVWEWCLNEYDRPEVTTIDHSGARRVVRGGSWLNLQSRARAAYRDFSHPAYRFNYIGFRLVRRPPSQ